MATYKDMQAQLKQYRNDGITLQVKLNAKADVLAAELERIHNERPSLYTVEELMSQADAIHTQCDLPSDYYCHGQSCLLPVRAKATVKHNAVKPSTVEIAKQVKAVAHPKPITNAKTASAQPIACKQSKRQSFSEYQLELRAKQAAAAAKREESLKQYQAECQARRDAAAKRHLEYIAERRYQAQLAHERRQARLLQEQLDRQARNAARKQRLANPAAREASYYAGHMAA